MGTTCLQLLGEDHPEVGLVVSNLAGLLKQCGRMAEAAPLIRRYLNIHEKAAKRDNRQVGAFPILNAKRNDACCCCVHTKMAGHAEPGYLVQQ